MHIPDAYLSPVTHAGAAAVMAPLWAMSARRTTKTLSTRQVPLLSLGAAFCFVIQMFNVPAVGGTTAHAVGATLLAILLGPWTALLAVSLALGVQALFFGDGGVLALGANSFNMGLVAVFSGYAVYRLLSGGAEMGSGRALLAAGVGAYVGSVLSAASTGLMLGIQPLMAHDAQGRALYFPFGVNVSVPAMVHIHLLVAAPVEAVITVSALAYLWRNFPELLTHHAIVRADKPVRLWAVLAMLLLLTPLGLLATGSAWGEWEEEALQQLVGYIPAGIRQFGEGVLRPLLPDYTLPGREGRGWETVAYILSAVVGATLTALSARALVRKPVPVPAETGKPGKPQDTLPAWLVTGEKSVTPSEGRRGRGRWLERTLLQVREAVGSAMAAEEWARVPGYLQSLHPFAKTLTALGALVAVSLAREAVVLLTLLAGVLSVAVASRLPLRTFVLRGGLTVLLFGSAVSLPVMLEAVTPGRTLWALFGWQVLALSDAGVRAGAMLLLRITAGVMIALLWSLTTPWHLLLRSLRSLRLPRWAVSALALTYRYLFTLMETMAEMVLARRSRQIGVMKPEQARTYAGVGTAVLFAKSLALNEEVYLAMRSRGFDGDLRRAYPRGWDVRDALWLVVTVLWVIGAFWIGGRYGG